MAWQTFESWFLNNCGNIQDSTKFLLQGPHKAPEATITSGNEGEGQANMRMVGRLFKKNPQILSLIFCVRQLYLTQEKIGVLFFRKGSTRDLWTIEYQAYLEEGAI